MNREILRLAIPNILSNISIPLLSAVDTALMGNLSPFYLGAIGLGSMIFNFIYWNFGFLRMGTTGMVAQAYGEDNVNLMDNLLVASLRLSFLLSVGIMLLSPWLFEVFNSLLLIDDKHNSIVSKYIYIRILDAPATLGIYVLMGWFFGSQNAFIPLLVTIIINGANIVLSYTLVHFYGWDISGVAWGTVLSQYLGFFMLLLIYSTKRGGQSFKWLFKRSIPSVDVSSFFKINIDLFVRTVSLTLSFLLLYRWSNLSGPVVLAANVIILQMISWVSFVTDGFAFAAESIVGKYKGRNSNKKLLKAVTLIMKWGMVLAFCFTLTYWLFTEKIIDIYTADQMVFSEVKSLKFIIILMPLIGFLCYIYDGIFIGLLQTQAMRDTMIFSLILYILMLIYFGDKGNVYLWVSFSLFLGLRGLSQTLYWAFKIKRELVH